MEAYIVDWLNLGARWVHLITGIAWIGASFYFVWLDNHQLPPKDPRDTERGIGGEVWSVHGGGFYQAQKFKVAPPTLPEPLHWFKWEAYWTWMSGIFLLALIYWYSAEIYLIDPGVADLNKPYIHHYGIYSNRSQHKPRKDSTSAQAAQNEDPPCVSDSNLRRRWANLIRRVYLANPLICQKCGSNMRIISFITQPGCSQLPKATAIARLSLS